MSEEEILNMFKEFNSRFEETVFTLIAKFNEVKDSFNRVQEGLDFLGKVRIQIAENKVLTSKLTQTRLLSCQIEIECALEILMLANINNCNPPGWLFSALGVKFKECKNGNLGNKTMGQ